ncbi:DNA polymerase III subunit alpha [Sulfurirhabdus autotrophica]|uniref:DNA polymerase III subunit alpha n=1 Tax=Sulfurirhabdus autotrophica TaxID=1706046 RepID=A0A4R3Y6L9_9PROT|nr:DNA polymerase III subunit alpha [Sulfurirhabdus autotrophica]TCV87477.1 DNA polymerase-3 subunit alpha [Sulfurirhabdus autotrophica]
MSDPSFIHLRLHSEFSIVDGIVRIGDAVKRAAADKMPALALTDLSNMFGMVKFYKKARGQGIKPIVGCDVWVTNEVDRDKPTRLLLLTQNRQGYLNLCELISRGYRTNQHRGRAEISKAWLAEGLAENLIALSGAHMGDIGVALQMENLDEAARLAGEWDKLFPQRFYIELQRTGMPQMENYVQRALNLASELKLPVVATHPIQFMDTDDFKAHEARVCIAEGAVLGDQRRAKAFTAEQYFKSQQDMATLFADVPEALANTIEIAKRCNLTIELGNNKLPQFPTPEGMTLDDFMCQEAANGLKVRMELLYPDPVKREEQMPVYLDRLKFETDTIVQMGFPGYFLIVADFINWAKHNGVPVGPGRGSGAGSLVAYVLGITDLDPLRYDLLFERFLNPERVSMPDFDVDFCQDGRERVIEYVRDHYGADSVSQIATFGTLGSKSVIRDVGRVLEMPYNMCDQLSKLVPIEGVKPVSLQKALEMEPQLKERYDNEEEVRELFSLAEKLEDLTRNVGMHAGGVLIAPGKLTDFCPLYCAQGSESVVSQFDKDDVEQIGLVKFDFLGLRTLTIIDWAVRYIRDLKRQAGADDAFNIETIPLDDVRSYRLLKDCNTTAVFQLESRGMKDLIRRLQPDCFDDIVALVALFRPGPLQSGMVDDFINRKHGKAKVDYMHPNLEATLKPTYGVIVYQEQVMQIAQILGGYSLGSADMLRRAMGKKKAEEMAEHRSIFVGGATERDVEPKKAEYLFDLMEKFAEYGFNKSHSAAYALVAYQTAFLKAHFPSAFMASTMSADMDDTDKVHTFYDDCLVNGLEVLPPDINSSEYRFVPVNDKQIRYGLGAIKGTGEAAINAIVNARNTDGPFKDLFDVCRRVDKRIVNRRVLESLAKVGAFDSLNDNRATMLASVGIALNSAEQASRDVNQSSLFSLFDDDAGHQVQLVEAPRWNDREQLIQEKACLGYYFSGHPYTSYAKEISGFVRTRLKDLSPQQQPVFMAGVVYSTRTQMTRRGKMMIVSLDDSSTQIEVTVFSELVDAHRDLLKEDQLLVIEGKVTRDDYSGPGSLRVTAEKLYDLTGARTRFAKAIHISCNGQANSGKLQELLSPYRNGGCPVTISYRNNRASCDVELGETWRVQLHDNLLLSLSDWLDAENIRIRYQ